MKNKNVTKKVESNMVSQTQTEIMQGISNFLTITEIAEHRKTSRQAVYKVMKSLIDKGLVQKTGMVCGLTEKGKKSLHSFMGFTNKLRQHNLGIKIAVLESQRNWDKKRNIIVQMPYFNKRIQLNNNYYDLLRFGKVGIKTTSKSVIFRLPTIFDSSVDGAILQAMDILFETIPKVENRFKIKLIKNDKLNITIISQEYARLNDALARLYKAEDNKLYITGEDGKVWLIADYSFSTSELETIHPNKAGEDMTTIHKFMNDLRKNPLTMSEIFKISTNNTQNLQKSIEVIQNNQNLIIGLPRMIKQLEAQISSHLKLIQEYRKENIGWRKAKTKEIRKEIKLGKQTKLTDFLN